MSPIEVTQEPLTFVSYHRGLSIKSLIRIPLGLLLFGVQYGAYLYLMSLLFDPDQLVHSALMIICLLASLIITAGLISRFVPRVPLERLRLLPDQVEWLFDLEKERQINSFKPTNCQLNDVGIDYLELTTSEGARLRLHRCWSPLFQVKQDRVSYCYLIVEGDRLALQGVKTRLNETDELTELYLCPTEDE